jgi:adenylyltransferase/sulfurtransferase
MDVLSKKNMKAMFRHGARYYPQECCGVVFSDGTVHRAENIQQRLHERSPEIYSRNAATGYAFSIADTELLSSSFDTPNPVLVVYHSHPDVGAYFSEEDKTKALFCGEPIFPVSYLVLDIRKGEPFGAKLFAFFDGDFHCTEVFDEKGLKLNKKHATKA